MTPEALAALHRLCFISPRPWSTDEFRALLAQPMCHLDVRENAFILGRTIAGEAELLTLAVHPEHRRAGIGRSLIAAFEAAAQTRQATEAFLEVSATNHAANALYEACGYRELGRRKGYYAGVDARVLRKSLTEDAQVSPLTETG